MLKRLVANVYWLVTLMLVAQAIGVVVGSNVAVSDVKAVQAMSDDNSALKDEIRDLRANLDMLQSASQFDKTGTVGQYDLSEFESIDTQVAVGPTLASL
ncbi:hypothetical protein IJJ12_01670 [bacterium]|nr:hypothetical protein [bacterium]